MRVCHQGSWPNLHNTEAEYRFAVDRSVNAKSSNVVPGEKSNELRSGPALSGSFPGFISDALPG